MGVALWQLWGASRFRGACTRPGLPAEADASRLQGLTQEQLALLALEMQRAAAQQAIVNFLNNAAEPALALTLLSQGIVGGVGLETAGACVQGGCVQPAAEEAFVAPAGRLPQRRASR